MKTAMQELRNDILIEIKLGYISEHSGCRILNYIDELYLEKEKNQIMISYYEDLFRFIDGKNEFINAEDYYNQTYNNENTNSDSSL
jgi:hypothetical protein